MPHAGLIEVVSMMTGRWFRFGLWVAYYRGLCPKLDWVLTQNRFLPRFVSEVGLGSDSASLFTQSCVQSSLRFRHRQLSP